MSEVARLYRFRATHSLPEFPAPWCHPHQHDYTVELVAPGGTDTDGLDDYWSGLELRDGLDLNQRYAPTTVEHIAEELLGGLAALVRVTVWEDRAEVGVGVTVILLVTTGHPDMLRYAHPHLGRLVQPRHYSSIEQTAHAGIPWAADNDAFHHFDAAAFERMLHRLRGLPGCRFIAAPDAVGDAAQTEQLFRDWRPRMLGLPVALVAQDGVTPADVPWGEIDALFIGGGDAFELGPDGERMAVAAREQGKWLHVGRVNGMRRLRYCATLRADSVDGSSWARWKATWLRDGLTGVAQSRQPRLGEVA